MICSSIINYDSLQQTTTMICSNSINYDSLQQTNNNYAYNDLQQQSIDESLLQNVKQQACRRHEITQGANAP